MNLHFKIFLNFRRFTNALKRTHSDFSKTIKALVIKFANKAHYKLFYYYNINPTLIS
jgi:hypothetical protein